MMRLAKACFIAAVAAGATLSTMAESTATMPQPKLQAIAAEKAARDAESAKILQRMKAMRLPEVALESSKTMADAFKFFCEASKKYDLVEIPVEKRGFNMILETGGAAAPVIPMLKLSDVSFYDALKYVCARVGYEFEINYEADLAKAIVTIKPCDNSTKRDNSAK